MRRTRNDAGEDFIRWSVLRSALLRQYTGVGEQVPVGCREDGTGCDSVTRGLGLYGTKPCLSYCRQASLRSSAIAEKAHSAAPREPSQTFFFSLKVVIWDRPTTWPRYIQQMSHSGRSTADARTDGKITDGETNRRTGVQKDGQRGRYANRRIQIDRRTGITDGSYILFETF